ncbi:Striatin-4, partial [Ophiophagus hannah]
MDTIGGGEVSLGDLADLTVTNDNELSCDVSSLGDATHSGCRPVAPSPASSSRSPPCSRSALPGGPKGRTQQGSRKAAQEALGVESSLSCFPQLSDSKDAFKKTWNPKFTLRSHYDGIRALVFHHRESALVTASEDGTLKLWNLQKTVAAKKNAALDVEPVYAFRGHSPSQPLLFGFLLRGPVLSVAMGCNSEFCYSGGLDARIRCWKIPDLGMDPYDGYGPASPISSPACRAPSAPSEVCQMLPLSLCGIDPSVLHTVLDGHTDAVWSLAFSLARNRLASCSADGTVRIWDPCSGSCLSTYNADCGELGWEGKSRALYGGPPVCEWKEEVVRPEAFSLDLTLTVAFWLSGDGEDSSSPGGSWHSVGGIVVASQPSLSLPAGHDCSLRLWNLDNKTCTQEITAHRKKHEEAIHDVAFHPSKALIASAGADALAKVFV